MRCPENLSQNKGKLEGALIISYRRRGEETDVPQDQVAGRCRQVTSAQQKGMTGEEDLTSNQFLKVYFLFLANLETRCVVFLKDELLLSWELFQESLLGTFLCFLSCSFSPSLHETSQGQEQHLFPTEEPFESMALSSSFVACLLQNDTVREILDFSYLLVTGCNTNRVSQCS